MDIKEITRQAKEEIKQENFRAAVEAEKTRLRNKKSLLDQLFPYKILIIKKG